MSEDKIDKFILLPHHEQQALCTNRLPYRQGRKLTAVKVYSINNESKHLLVFGVPSLNLRQETKALFSRFGRLQFNITKYPSEQFTETYHAVYEDIQSARIAKKMLDTKNYYGGSLHICYAPELESIEETREKFMLRQKSVTARLKNLQKAAANTEQPINKTYDIENVCTPADTSEKNKLFMGHENSIQFGKRNATDFKSVKKLKAKKSRNIDIQPSFTNSDVNNIYLDNTETKNSETSNANNDNDAMTSKLQEVPSSSIEIIDFTSTEKEVLTNINESLNYSNFGKELIKTVPYRPVNKIKFNLNKKS